MNDLRPFQPKPNAPLSGSARFIRGFTRIGALVAVLVVLIGIPSSIIGAISSYDTAMKSYQSAQCIARLARSGYTFKKKEYGSSLEYNVGGCDGYHHSYASVSEVTAIADAPAPTFVNAAGSWLGWGLIITGGLAVVTYLSFWAIGWVFAGFTKDS